ncbi:hypothetical protein [Bacillus cereus]|uniref:hypothetical protein n=1 Tax=Bacillus cereus TaxID=1396 RepID=UPI00032DB32C|nr:hypothetical protein [Bacillus cereus]EOO44175.1 hypothetical protein ICK_06432 [Bacillus cereus BAG1X2-2]EOP00426.1 hypothetical protein ICO_06382 [Bacillus cereus BAG2O-1]
MNKKEKVEAFLEELNTLSEKYGFEITSEGNSPLLYDIEKQEYLGEFWMSMFTGKYAIGGNEISCD